MCVAIVLAISLLFGIGRFMIPGHDVSWPGTYEALAHIWTGAAIILAFKAKERSTRVAAGWSIAAISLLELVMSLLR